MCKACFNWKDIIIPNTSADEEVDLLPYQVDYLVSKNLYDFQLYRFAQDMYHDRFSTIIKESLKAAGFKYPVDLIDAEKLTDITSEKKPGIIEKILKFFRLKK